VNNSIGFVAVPSSLNVTTSTDTSGQ